MAAFLLDANILVALAWPKHSHHSVVHDWFNANIPGARWATCPFTEAAFVRLSSNPKVFADALSVQDAFELLESQTAHPAHEFWEDSISLTSPHLGVRASLRGYRQVTDAYLLSLAIARGGRFATLDRGILALARTKEQADAIVVISDQIASP